MTTIVAIRGKDGVVMCADTLATDPRKWEYAIKITPVANNALLACSGADYYISLFTRFIREALDNRKNEDYYDTVRAAIRSYTKDIKEDLEISESTENEIKSLCYPAGILAACDPKSGEYHVFEIQTPYPPKPMSYPYRATVGSGSFPADVFLKNTEYLFTKIELHWIDISTSLIAQFVYILMRRVAHVDPRSSGASVYRLNKIGSQEWNPKTIFGNLSKDDYQLTTLIQNAIKEIGPNRLLSLAKEYKLLGTLDSFGAKLQGIV